MGAPFSLSFNMGRKRWMGNGSFVVAHASRRVGEGAHAVVTSQLTFRAFAHPTAPDIAGKNWVGNGSFAVARALNMAAEDLARQHHAHDLHRTLGDHEAAGVAPHLRDRQL